MLYYDQVVEAIKRKRPQGTDEKKGEEAIKINVKKDELGR